MNKLLRSTLGTIVVAAFLAMTPPMYARGHGGHRGGHGGHGGKHASAAHAKGGHTAFRVRGGGRGQRFGGRTRYAGGAYYATRGGNWGGYYGYPRYSLGYYGLGYSYPYYGYYGYRSGWCYDPYYGYYPCGYYPYRYGYWPNLSFSFGFGGY
jgi:hypothetical protein